MKRLLLSSLIGACVIMGIAGCGPQQNGMTHEAIYASLDDKMKAALEPVSYTHLTLPTKRIV